MFIHSTAEAMEPGFVQQDEGMDTRQDRKRRPTTTAPTLPHGEP